MLDRTESTDRPARRTALIAQELSRYNVDVAALSETRISDEGSIAEDLGGYTFFWKGYPLDENRIHGVAFAIRSSLLKSCDQNPVGLSARLMKFRMPLANSRYATLFSCYAPTLMSDEQDKNEFYNHLDEELRRVPVSDKLIVLGDFNARVGRDNLAWSGVMGNHGMGNVNPNGHRLLALCAQNELFIANTAFQLRDIYKGTWTHPRSKHVHMIDYCITRQRDKQDVHITRVMRGAECWTDHYLLRSKFSLHVRPPLKRRAAKRRLNCRVLESKDKREELSEAISEKLKEEMPTDVETGWKHLLDSVAVVAAETVGFTTRKNQDWFDANLPGIQDVLQSKHRALAAHLSNPASVYLKEKWKEKRASAQRMLRQVENDWWMGLAAEIQGFADSGDLHNFYEALKRVYGPSDRSLAPVRSRDGRVLLSQKSEIMDRWKEHYSTLLNTHNPINSAALTDIPHHPTIRELDEPPSMEELTNSLSHLKNNKSPGVDGIPSEILKHGGEVLRLRLFELVGRIWEREGVPQQWKDARIISIYKKKGDRATCGNSRGISLLAVAGKVLARILLVRLNKYIVDRVCPESQCGFRRERGTTDMIFVARQLQEKCREQCRNLSIAFIDLSKAFDTVDRGMLWDVLERFGCPLKFVNVVRSFHDGMMATVVIGGEETDAFEVGVGVKQGCAMAPVLFNIFLAAATCLFRQRQQEDHNIHLTYRLDGSLFNLRRLKAQTLVSHDGLTELQYADDCALVAHSPEELQTSLNVLQGVYADLGLVINADKTEILHQWHEAPSNEIPNIFIDDTPLKVTNKFMYLGAILSSDCSIDAELCSRIGKASSAFAKIREKVIRSHNLSLTTRVAVYKAICLSVLLYGCETLTLYARHIRLLERFHIRCIREMLGLGWQDRVPHVEMLARVNLTSIECMVARNQLRWIGHVYRMPPERYPRRVLYGQLSEGTRPAHGPKKRYKDHLKKTMKSFNMLPGNLEIGADDRDGWRALVHRGSAYFEEKRTDQREHRRTRRHEMRQTSDHVNQSDPRLRCPECGRQCLSRIGLHSHGRTHQQRSARGRHVIIDSDGPP